MAGTKKKQWPRRTDKSLMLKKRKLLLIVFDRLCFPSLSLHPFRSCPYKKYGQIDRVVIPLYNLKTTYACKMKLWKSTNTFQPKMFVEILKFRKFVLFLCSACFTNVKELLLLRCSNLWKTTLIKSDCNLLS